MQGAKKGVLGLLEVIHTDFSRVKSDTEVDEAQAVKEYDTFMEESAKDKEVTYANRLSMQRERTAKERDLASAEEDLSATQGELDAALAYYAKLKPDCIADGLSYAERKYLRILEGSFQVSEYTTKATAGERAGCSGSLSGLLRGLERVRACSNGL